MAEEKVQGGFEVSAELKMGSERLFLLFTQTQLILAHVVKVGTSSMALSGILGRLARGAGRSPEKTSLLEKMAGLAPESILAMDRDNFAVPYAQVVSLTVKPGDHNQAALVLVTGDMKLEMSASLTAIQGLRESIGSWLGQRVIFTI